MLPVHCACMCSACQYSPEGSEERAASDMLQLWALSSSACVRQLCVCVCVSVAARPQYKRGHRKTASFGTILDVPKIVVTGTSADHQATWCPGCSWLDWTESAGSSVCSGLWHCCSCSVCYSRYHSLQGSLAPVGANWPNTLYFVFAFSIWIELWGY